MPKRGKEQLISFDLKGSRESMGLSQIETAKILCVNQSSISRWELDGNLPLIYRKYWELYHGSNKEVARDTGKRKRTNERRGASKRSNIKSATEIELSREDN